MRVQHLATLRFSGRYFLFFIVIVALQLSRISLLCSLSVLTLNDLSVKDSWGNFSKRTPRLHFFSFFSERQMN